MTTIARAPAHPPFQGYVTGESDGARRMHTLEAYRAVRAQTLSLAAPLSAEDQQVQSMPDASPTKWHLAHTSWFFETFVLGLYVSGYRTLDPSFNFLFNSYYNAIGDRLIRPSRGLITRPSLGEV